MHTSAVGPDEFHQAVRACGHVLINALTPAEELRHFLVDRLYTDGFPGAATHLAGLGDGEVCQLRDDILAALRANPPSPLWDGRVVGLR